MTLHAKDQTELESRSPIYQSAEQSTYDPHEVAERVEFPMQHTSSATPSILTRHASATGHASFTELPPPQGSSIEGPTTALESQTATSDAMDINIERHPGRSEVGASSPNEKSGIEGTSTTVPSSITHGMPAQIKKRLDTESNDHTHPVRKYTATSAATIQMRREYTAGASAFVTASILRTRTLNPSSVPRRPRTYNEFVNSIGKPKVYLPAVAETVGSVRDLARQLAAEKLIDDLNWTSPKALTIEETRFDVHVTWEQNVKNVQATLQNGATTTVEYNTLY